MLLLLKAPKSDKDALIKKVSSKCLPVDLPLHKPNRWGLSSFLSKQGGPAISVPILLRLLLQEYRREQAHRKAAIKLMFTAAAGIC